MEVLHEFGLILIVIMALQFLLGMLLIIISEYIKSKKEQPKILYHNYKIGDMFVVKGTKAVLYTAEVSKKGVSFEVNGEYHLVDFQTLDDLIEKGILRRR